MIQIQQHQDDTQEDQDDHIAPPTLHQVCAKVLQSFFDIKEDEESSWTESNCIKT